jgi:hypothetical protein
VIDVNKFGSEKHQSKENSGGFSWGYPMQRYLKTLSDLNGKKSRA